MPDTPSSKDDLTLPRGRVLRIRADYEQVRSEGRRLTGRHLSLNYWCAPGRERQVGFIVPKNCGSAVERNRIRRRLREIYRHLQGRLPENLRSVWIARRSAAGATFDSLKQEVPALYERAGVLPKL